MHKRGTLMKKTLLLIPALLLVACNNQTPKYDITSLKPAEEVIIPEAKVIDEEQARSLTADLVVTYRDSSSDSIRRKDFEFKYSSRELTKIENDSYYNKTSLMNFRVRGATERYFSETKDAMFVLSSIPDTLLIHKQTKKYGNVMYVSKEDPDLDHHYTLVYTEKYSPFSAGSMSVTIAHFSTRRVAEAYNTVSDYNKFFNFVNNADYNHTVKYASRGKGSVIMETTSTAINPTLTINDIPISKVKYKIEFFENFLMNYEYVAYNGETIVKNDTLSVTYERPEIELPEKWEYYLDD